MAQSRNQRKRIPIDLRLQGGVVLRLLFLWTATSVVAAFVAVVMRFYANPELGFLGHLSEPSNWTPSLIAFFVTLPIACLDLMRYLHRVVGPLHRFREQMRLLADGESPQPLRSREGDGWRQLAEVYNALGIRIEQHEHAPATPQESLVGSGGAA